MRVPKRLKHIWMIIGLTNFHFIVDYMLSCGIIELIPSSLDIPTRTMKITRIETYVCHARMRNWIFVKVLTDTPGLWGWGEATLEWHTRGVVGSVEDLA